MVEKLGALALKCLVASLSKMRRLRSTAQMSAEAETSAKHELCRLFRDDEAKELSTAVCNFRSERSIEFLKSC